MSLYFKLLKYLSIVDLGKSKVCPSLGSQQTKRFSINLLWFEKKTPNYQYDFKIVVASRKYEIHIFKFHSLIDGFIDSLMFRSFLICLLMFFTLKNINPSFSKLIFQLLFK